MSQEPSQCRHSPFTCSDGTTLSVSVRLSKKARSQRVVFHYQGHVELVIPARMRRVERLQEPECVARFLEEKRSWIERVARKAAPAIDSYRESLAVGLPTHLEFLALGELWVVKYHVTSAARITIKVSASTQANTVADATQKDSVGAALDATVDITTNALANIVPNAAVVLHGPIENEELCFEALRRFIGTYAKEQLPLFAWSIVGELEVARQLFRRPAAITVNRRKSAWGVCSKDGHIRIDQKVIFLPKDLARQIVLHELAHLSHLNHQKAFYDELYSYEGSSREAERSIKEAIRFIPAWF